MWWIRYGGEGKTSVDNIGVFEDDASPRKKHPLLLDPSPKAQPLHMPVASPRRATTSTLPALGARTAMSPATVATATGTLSVSSVW